MLGQALLMALCVYHGVIRVSDHSEAGCALYYGLACTIVFVPRVPPMVCLARSSAVWVDSTGRQAGGTVCYAGERADHAEVPA